MAENMNAEALLERAVDYLVEKEYDKAITDFTEVIALEPEHWLAYRNRSKCFAQKKQWDKAIADYNEVIRLNPKQAPYLSRAEAYLAKGDLEKAEADFNRALEGDSDEEAAGTYYTYGSSILEHTGDKKKAADCFRKSIELGDFLGASQKMLDRLEAESKAPTESKASAKKGFWGKLFG